MRNQNLIFLSILLSLFILLLCANGEVMAEHKVSDSAEQTIDIQRITIGPACDRMKCIVTCERKFGLTGNCVNGECECNGKTRP
ncbi:unnamed protein product [Trifolium pratense]|uniref:Uncharacterized protein n=1 Tax=Trifolium pratense TaxID=57577 RepID=A0ACB0JTV3_TRIPR|nr:unnamed protein product [Trifolium pratense]